MDTNVLTVSELQNLDFLYITPRSENLLCLFGQIVDAYN
jgi:hypothetical protein